MAGTALPPAFTRIALDSVGSTSDVARERAAAGAPAYTVVTASRQTAGRGRRGRTWTSPPGNLYASLIVRPGRPAGEAATLGYAAGLAAIEAVDELLAVAAGTGQPGPARPVATLKWPNDVLVDGAKLAGLLLETVGADPAPALVIGFGANVEAAPGDTPYRAARLATWAPEATPDRLLAAYLTRYLAWETRWREGGFAALRPHWLARAHGQGGPVTVALGAETVAGRFADLDPSGRLVLDTVAGRRLVSAGDVHFQAA